MDRPPTRDRVATDLLDRLVAQRRLLAGYREALFGLPGREQDAATLVRAERHLDDAIDRLQRWHVVQPKAWREASAAR